jgi:hypothetical protein
LISCLILMHDPLPALIGIGIVLCGIPFRILLVHNRAAVPVTSARS